MPDVEDSSHLRLETQLKEFATLKIVKEEIKPSGDDPATTDSDVEGPKPKYKQHCKGMQMNDSFKTASDAEWKKLCMKYFDFINQKVTSHKSADLNAAIFAAEHDFECINYINQSKRTAVLREDKLVKQLQNKLNGGVDKSVFTETVAVDYDSKTFTYKDLFLKLTFE